MRTRLLALLIPLTLAGCAAKARVAPAIDLSPRLLQADGLLRAGCFDCLGEALATYQAARAMPGAPAPAIEQATSGALRAAALLALRQRELGMVDDGYLAKAREMRAAVICGASGLSCDALDRILEVIELLPLASFGPASDADLANRQRLFSNRQAWSAQLYDVAGQDPLAAYTWLAYACGPSGTTTREDTFAPLGALRDLPLLQFKMATCYATQTKTLQALQSADPKFKDVAYPLGLAAIGLLKLDDADAALAEAHAWHPGWPAATLSIANVAMTAEDFDRSLAFYEETLTLEPKATDALLGKLRALSYLGRHEPAIAVADQLVAGRWHVGDAFYWRAWNDAQLDRLDEAWRDIESADALLLNALVPKLAGQIAYRRTQLDVARTRFDLSLSREARDCETAFYLGVVLAEQRAWERTATVFKGALSCFSNNERNLTGEIESIRVSDSAPARKARLIASREQQIAATRRLKAQSTFNTAVAYFNLSRGVEARPYAETVADDDQFGERARELLSRLK